MTAKEIARLEALKWPPIGVVRESEWLVRLPWTTVPLDDYALIQAAVPRLLEERRRLLDALRGLRTGHTDRDAHCDRCPEIMDAAIAFAEEGL